MLSYARILVLCFALLGVVFQDYAVAAELPTGSFLTQPVNDTTDLCDLIASQEVVSQRYSAHFKIDAPALSDYFSKNLRTASLKKSIKLRMYTIAKDGRIQMKKKRLPAGRKVFVDLSGRLILDGESGCPLMKKPLPTPATNVNYTRSKRYGSDRIEFTVAGHTGFIILPTVVEGSKRIPWVWYAPTFIAAGYPNESNGWICRKLLDQGFAICGVDVGESYGNPAGRAAFTEFYKFVIENHNLSTKACLWPQSRGGLMLYNWAAEHPESVQCIGGTYTVCDMRSYPGLQNACGAYGMSEAELQAHLKEHNPIDRLAPIAAHKIPIFHIHGDSDGVVPLEVNTAELASRYRALGGNIEVVIVKGKGHAEIAEFFESQKMVDFFIANGKK